MYRKKFEDQDPIENDWIQPDLKPKPRRSETLAIKRHLGRGGIVIKVFCPINLKQPVLPTPSKRFLPENKKNNNNNNSDFGRPEYFSQILCRLIIQYFLLQRFPMQNVKTYEGVHSEI
jgi:hypothetical protein